MGLTGRELKSRVDADGTLTLSIEQVDVGDPAADEVVVRVEAAPINPSDLGLLLGAADVATLTPLGGGRPGLTFSVPRGVLPAMKGRLGQAITVGNEGAGTVVSAGPGAAHLMGRRVGMYGGGMFADYRRIAAHLVTPLPEGATAADGASMHVNPLTALAFVETARLEGHGAIIHTAAASNLGQMLQRICLMDGVPLINIVRSDRQGEMLRGIGATHVIDSRGEDFVVRLTAAIEETGATIAFDAIGGGTLGSRIVQAMERGAVRRMAEYSRYGSDVFKQLYIYGVLDPSPTTLNRMAFGFRWSVSGWLLQPFLQRFGAATEARLRQRVADELTTTFASHYSRVVGLAEALDPDVLRTYERKATGEKFLIDPTRG